jgi:hypothetical protein
MDRRAYAAQERGLRAPQSVFILCRTGLDTQACMGVEMRVSDLLGSFHCVEGTMQTTSQAEIRLDEIDECIADADRNIRQLGSLIPELATNGHPTAEIEDKLTLMTKALHSLRAQRRTIVEALDGHEPPPRIARPTARAGRRAATLVAAPVASTQGASTWRAIYMRLKRT